MKSLDFTVNIKNRVIILIVLFCGFFFLVCAWAYAFVWSFYGCMCVSRQVWWRAEDNLWKLVLFLNHVHSVDWTTGKHLFLLCHLGGVLFITFTYWCAWVCTCLCVCVCELENKLGSWFFSFHHVGFSLSYDQLCSASYIPNNHSETY